LAAPKRTSATPAASASLTKVMSRPSPFSKSASASRPAVGDAAERRDDLDDGGEDRLRLAAGRRRELDPLAQELAAVDVDDGSLDPGSADVDSQCSCHGFIFR
jgi:hypothetical protein